jgi:putative nucleotidyltransferase with HDIG domain
MSLNTLRGRTAVEHLARFTVQSLEFRRRDDDEFLRLEVADHSDTATLRWWRSWDAGELPQVGDALESIVTPRCLDGRLWLDTGSARWISRDERMWDGPALVPRREVPASAHVALDALVALFDTLQHPPVKAFLGRVFTDPCLTARFVRCRASARHHHAQTGGLLVHSVAVATRCLACAADLAVPVRELVVAAALLHDVGKIETVGEGPGRPELARWVHHEALTLELLSMHLRWLDAEWPHGGALLRHCLTWYSTKPAGFAAFVGADLLRAMDGIDAGMALGKIGDHARFAPFPRQDRASN